MGVPIWRPPPEEPSSPPHRKRLRIQPPANAIFGSVAHRAGSRNLRRLHSLRNNSNTEQRNSSLTVQPSSHPHLSIDSGLITFPVFTDVNSPTNADTQQHESESETSPPQSGRESRLSNRPHDSSPSILRQIARMREIIRQGSGVNGASETHDDNNGESDAEGSSPQSTASTSSSNDAWTTPGFRPVRNSWEVFPVSNSSLTYQSIIRDQRVERDSNSSSQATTSSDFRYDPLNPYTRLQDANSGQAPQRAYTVVPSYLNYPWYSFYPRDNTQIHGDLNSVMLSIPPVTVPSYLDSVRATGQSQETEQQILHIEDISTNTSNPANTQNNNAVSSSRPEDANRDRMRLRYSADVYFQPNSASRPHLLTNSSSVLPLLLSEREGVSSRRPPRRRGFRTAEAGSRMAWLVEKSHASGCLPEFSGNRTSEDIVNAFTRTGRRNSVSFKENLTEESPADLKDDEDQVDISNNRIDMVHDLALIDEAITNFANQADARSMASGTITTTPHTLTRSTSFSSSTSRRSQRQVHFTNPVSDIGNSSSDDSAYPSDSELQSSHRLRQPLLSTSIDNYSNDDDNEDDNNDDAEPHWVLRRAGTPPPVVLREMNSIPPFVVIAGFDDVMGGNDEDDANQDS